MVTSGFECEVHLGVKKTHLTNKLNISKCISFQEDRLLGT